MYNQTINNLPADVAVFAAAVSDYKVKNYKNEKMKKKRRIKFRFNKKYRYTC